MSNVSEAIMSNSKYILHCSYIYRQSWRNLNSVVTPQIYQTLNFDENNEWLRSYTKSFIISKQIIFHEDSFINK